MLEEILKWTFWLYGVPAVISLLLAVVLEYNPNHRETKKLQASSNNVHVVLVILVIAFLPGVNIVSAFYTPSIIYKILTK